MQHMSVTHLSQSIFFIEISLVRIAQDFEKQFRIFFKLIY